jgi:hypothetical protein
VDEQSLGFKYDPVFDDLIGLRQLQTFEFMSLSWEPSTKRPHDYAGLSVFSIHICQQLLHFVYISLQALYKAGHKDL